MIYGERIRQVREMHRMTQADLAEEVPSLTQSRLSRIEKDLSPIDAESLALIASVTGVSTTFFSRPPTQHFSVLTPQLRARSRLTQGEKASALQWARLVDEQFQALGAATRTLPVQIRPTRGAAPTEAAAYARRILGFDSRSPLPYLILAIERAGVTVLGLPYSTEMLDAFCVWRGERPAIALLNGVSGDRIRFSVAHELGHLLLHEPGQTGQQIEAEADQFAAELLTPLSAIRHTMPSNPTLSALVMLKTVWGVSVKSLVRRAREVGVVDGDRALSLYKQISARGWNKREPGYVAPEKPRAFRKMAEIAYGPAVRTAQLAEVASWSEQLTLEILDQYSKSDELPADRSEATYKSGPTEMTTGLRLVSGKGSGSNVIHLRNRGTDSI